MADIEKYDPNCLPDLLPIYYKKLFPYGPYYRWLSYGGVPKNYFTNREFSFTLKDDVYIRYQSFSDQQELEKEIQKRCPYKIDIGAIFTHRPKDHKTVKPTAFQAQEKELVFDIDMTDYDDVRNCCSGANICDKCWPLMTIAIKTLNRALREDFGFKHLLWVYSGRRGIHCWVSDEQARKLSQNARSAIAEYLSLIKGGDNVVKKVMIFDKRIHPSVKKAIEIVRDHFEEYAIKKQDFLGTDDMWEKVMQLVPDLMLRTEMTESLEKLKSGKLKMNDGNLATDSSKMRWRIIQLKQEGSKEKGEYYKSHSVTEEIMLQYAYPRLDVNVSKGVNHLLKSPFCIHPKTGRVCVPLDINDIDNFDPQTVPTLSQLCEEINNLDNKSVDGETKKIREYKRTSMKGAVKVFEEFVQDLEKSWRGKKLENSDIKKEF